MSLSFLNRREINYQKVVFCVLLTTLVSLAFQLRFINSLSLIALVGIVLIHPQRKSMVKKAFENYCFLSLAALFFMQLAGLLYASDVQEALSEVIRKAGLIAIPFFFFGFHFIQERYFKLLMFGFSVSLLVVSILCLLNAAYLFYKG